MNKSAPESSKEERPESKVQELTKRIRALAYERGPNARLPKARELYTLFETNWVILNAALEELEQQNVIVRKQGSGIFVSDKLYRKTISVIIGGGSLPSTYTSPFWGIFLEAFFHELQQRSHDKNEYYSLHLTMPRFGQQGFILPEDVVTMIKTRRMHAVIGILVDYTILHWIETQEIPCVSFAGYSPNMVALNMPLMIQQGVEYLQQQGCQRIGLWSAFSSDDFHAPPLSETPSTTMVELLSERMDHRHSEPVKTFMHALQEQNLSFFPELVRSYPLLILQTGSTFQKISLQEQGYRIAMDVFSNPSNPKPDGILITDDTLTSGVLIALQQLGVQVGKQVHIATHANKSSPTLLHQTSSMALLEFSSDELVAAMFTLLDDVLQEKNSTPVRIDIAPRLHVPGKSLFNSG